MKKNGEGEGKKNYSIESLESNEYRNGLQGWIDADQRQYFCPLPGVSSLIIYAEIWLFVCFTVLILNDFFPNPRPPVTRPSPTPPPPPRRSSMFLRGVRSDWLAAAFQVGWEMKGWPLFAVYARIVASNTRGRAGTCAPGSKDRDGRRGMNRGREGEWRRRRRHNQGTDTCERVFAGKTNTFLYSLHGSLILVPARILNARELIRRVSFFRIDRFLRFMEGNKWYEIFYVEDVSI